jgi:hypothetical protein
LKCPLVGRARFEIEQLTRSRNQNQGIAAAIQSDAKLWTAEFCEARSQLDGRRLRRAQPSIWEPFADLKSAIVDQRLLVGIAA